MKPDAKIVAYFERNKIFTLATSSENIPYCAICFYVYNEERNSLVFISSETTRHIREAALQPVVSGTVFSTEQSIASLKGIQFTGLLIKPEPAYAKKLYVNKFPFAMAGNHEFWEICLSYCKMTDNTLGFGKKIIWEKKLEVKSVPE